MARRTAMAKKMRNDTTQSWWKRTFSSKKESKNEFDCLYQSVNDEVNGVGVAYTRTGDFSVMFEITNPVEQFCADIDAYYQASEAFKSIVSILGEGYGLQKQDIFYTTEFSYQDRSGMKYLANAYMDYFTGRIVREQKTFLIITQEVKRGAFTMFDQKKWNEFWIKIDKIKDSLGAYGMSYHILNSTEIIEYLTRFLAVEWKEGAFSYDNFRVRENSIKIGERCMKMVDIIDIDEVILPAKIKPYSLDGELPVDLFSFLADVPGTECVIYTQSVIIPSQRKERAKLSKNMNQKNNFPDPANKLAAKDIKDLMDDIALNNKSLVYCNFSVMIVARGGEKELDVPYNFIERQFFNRGVGISKMAYNQLELFINSFPGNEMMLQDYNRFICLADAVSCFFFKEHLKGSEETPVKVFYTDRNGKPIAIDITGKEGARKLTTNSNFFSLGPSGSGKSFHMNSMVRQLYEQDTDIIMVDTGNSYEGLCESVKGKYITYTDENPITMNPFQITQQERNIEKMNFLKSLVLMIWKGADGELSKQDSDLIDHVLNKYYDFYFTPFEHFSEDERNDLKEMMMIEAKGGDMSSWQETAEERETRKKIHDKVKKLEAMAENGEGGEKTNAKQLIRTLLAENNLTITELDSPEVRLEKMVERRISIYEQRMSAIRVDSLNFNSFFEFSLQFIPILCEMNGIEFGLKSYRFALLKFYKGGVLERTLNDNMDKSLFDERFIVFEIDSIKDDPTLFPIVTLVIMDLFIQKMRLKRCRKALIIEEAWKAISSPLMEEYIKYLYKTVRKFWGIIGLVTQEVDDLISSPVVKKAILSNSEITILLDQSKFKDVYGDIASVLGLTEVDLRKIWTINKLDNREGRSYFKEVFIRRGSQSDVFGVEECPQSYMAYTTERVEKDALQVYIKRYGSFEKGNDRFCLDWEKTTGRLSKADKFASYVNSTVNIYSKEYGNAEKGMQKLMKDWRNYEDVPITDSTQSAFVYQISKKKKVWEKWGN